MNCRALTCRDEAEWRGALAAHPRSDVYFTPEYHRAFEINGDGRAVAFVAEEGSHKLFYPFMVRPVPLAVAGAGGPPYFDIETVYGYSGPVCNSGDPVFLSRAWAEFGSWCGAERIVAEFIRFNPLLQNQAGMESFLSVFPDRETVVLRLDRGASALWEEYTSVHRNMIRKAQRKGLTASEDSSDQAFAAFQALYQETMRRVAAGEYYFFSPAWLQSIREGLGPGLRLFVVRAGEQAVAAGLFMIHGDYMHYHLSGSDADFREAAPNNLLLHAAAEWGVGQGLKQLHLGGGRTSSPDDSLFRFKTSISKQRVGFFTGRRLHDARRYEELCSAWMRMKGVVDRPKYFLLYRLGLS